MPAAQTTDLTQYPTNHHLHGIGYAPDSCDDFYPIFAPMGRGPSGNAYRVEIASDTESATYLEGMEYDADTGTWTRDWLSENINGGRILYNYNINLFNSPPTWTFTMTYRREGRTEWSVTSYPIPIMLDYNADGIPDLRGNIGSGVADLWIRASDNEPWHECLHYPPATTGADFNAPAAGDPWSATITFGADGDVKVVNYYDMSTILGISYDDLINWITNNVLPPELGDYDNIINLINGLIDELRDKVYEDLGDFPQPWKSDGGTTTVFNYITDQITNINNNINTALGGSHLGFYPDSATAQAAVTADNTLLAFCPAGT